MKREYLESLELSKETIEKIMAEHGKTVQTLKTDLAEAQATVENQTQQIEQRDKDLAQLKDKGATVEELQEKINEHQARYEKQRNEYEEKVNSLRKSAQIELGVTKAGARNHKAVMALLDSETIELTEKGITGLSEQLESLKESEPYLFDTAKEPTGQVVNPGNPAYQNKDDSGALRRVIDKYTQK